MYICADLWQIHNCHYLWQIYMEVLNKIAQLKAELDSLRPLDKDREAAIIQKLPLDWNYHSNHLEGNSLTFGETKAHTDFINQQIEKAQQKTE